MVNLPENYELFPQTDKLANLVLKKLGYLTTKEQCSAARQASMSGIQSYLAGESPEKINFYVEQQAQFSDINPLRDLAQLQADGVNVAKALKEVKQTYNELVKVCAQRSPEFMDLIWQFYRRTHLLKADYHCLERIINPPEDIVVETKCFALRDFPKTDAERVKNYQFDCKFSKEDPAMQKEPFRRIVETDYSYFYNTGRFAFASINGDIFQTIWDERQKEIPLFKLD